MNPAYLIIWLHDVTAECFDWRLLDAQQRLIQGSRSLEQSALPLTELKHKAEHTKLIVLVPSRYVLLTKTQITARNHAQFLRALPYALEDDLTSDIDDLHFVAAMAKEAATTEVAVVARAHMQAWLSVLQAAELAPHLLIPELLAMPVTEQPTVLLSNQHVYIRSTDVNCCLDAAHLEAGLALLHEPQIIQEEHGLDRWAQHASAAAPLNLLQGAYAVKQKATQLQRFRLWAGILGVTWLGVSLIGSGVEALFLSHVVKTKTTALMQIYQTAFPDTTDISRGEMRQNINKEQQVLLRAAQEDDAIRLIRHIAQILPTFNHTSLQDLSYQDHSVTATVKVADFAALQALTHALNSQGFSAIANDAARQGTQVGAQIVIR